MFTVSSTFHHYNFMAMGGVSLAIHAWCSTFRGHAVSTNSFQHFELWGFINTPCPWIGLVFNQKFINSHWP